MLTAEDLGRVEKNTKLRNGVLQRFFEPYAEAVTARALAIFDEIRSRLHRAGTADDAPANYSLYQNLQVRGSRRPGPAGRAPSRQLVDMSLGVTTVRGRRGSRRRCCDRRGKFARAGQHRRFAEASRPKLRNFVAFESVVERQNEAIETRSFVEFQQIGARAFGARTSDYPALPQRLDLDRRLRRKRHPGPAGSTTPRQRVDKAFDGQSGRC